ncbi:MAG: hypothetical protein KIT84_40205 [Labilithrix sp.]|nr:hypothetical protein [Labilithrix sp.]MCW5817290.1 hypothetical protein [Labilithrix sp.]
MTTTTVNYAGQALQMLRFDGKEDLQRRDPTIFEKVRDSVFKEYDPMLASIAAGWPGTVVYGDVRFPHTEETEASCFEDFYDALGEDHGKSLVFAGSLDVERGMMLPDRARVVVLGDLATVGLCNVQCEIWVEGTTTIAGGLYFDSNNGGYTKLTLAVPAGFIATSANLFDVELRAKYYFDPLFRCGFGATPTTRHEEIITEAFRPGERVQQVTLDDLADFFTKMNPEVGEEVRAGDYGSWLEVLLATLDSRSLVTFLDERYG